MKKESVRKTMSGLVVLVVVASLWFLATTFGDIPRGILPTIPDIWVAFTSNMKSGQLVGDLLVSLTRVVKGFAVAAILGISVGTVVGMSRTAREMLLPAITVIRQIPIIAWIPLIILWAGIGEGSKVIIIAIAAFFPIMVNTESGIEQTPQGLIEVAKLYKLGKWKTFKRVCLPHALPQMLVGLRLGLGVSWMAVVAAELIAATSGIGYRLSDARSLMRADVVIVCMIVIGLVGVAMDKIIGSVFQWLMPWEKMFKEKIQNRIGKKMIAGIAAIALAVAGLAGCGSTQADTVKGDAGTAEVKAAVTDEDNASAGVAEQTGDYIKVRLGCVGQGDVLLGAIGVADSLGYLKEELNAVGYEPEIIGFAQAGPAINEAFAAGELDAAIYGDLPATVAKSNGTDTTIFATYNSEEQMGIFVRKGVDDVKSAADLAGHKVIVARGTIYHQYFKSIINKAGVSEDSIEQINTFSDANSLIASGDADVLITSTSIAYYLESLGYGTLIEDSTGDPSISSQFFGVGLTSFLKENPDAAKAIIRAMIRGKEYVEENPAEAYKIWADKGNGYTADIYEKVYAYDLSFSYFSPEITSETVEKLEALNDFLLSEGLITNSVDAGTFVDNSYYEEAVSELSED